MCQQYKQYNSELFESVIQITHMGTGCSLLTNTNTSALPAEHQQHHQSPFKLIYRLLDAAALGNVSLLEKILSMGAKVEDCDYFGRTALHLACAEGRVEMVRHLLKCGCAADARDRTGREPLDEAVQNGHVHVVSVLEEAGAVLSAEARADYEETMRQYAHDGNITGLSCLIRGGISPLPRDYLGLCAFQIAADSGHKEMVEYLLTTGHEQSRSGQIGDAPQVTCSDERQHRS